jgi:hypothetical protein
MARKARSKKTEEAPTKKKAPAKKVEQKVEQKETRELPDVIHEMDSLIGDLRLYLSKAQTVPAMNKLARNTAQELKHIITEFRASSLDWEKDD